MMADDGQPGVYFTLMRDERYQVPRYEHWWQGWRERLRSAIRMDVEVDYVADGDGGEHPVVTGKTRRFCGWDELLRPTDTRTRFVPASPRTVSAKGTLNGGAIEFGDIEFSDLNAVPVNATVYMKDGNGTLLAEIPVAVSNARPGDTVHIQPTITITEEIR